MKIDQTVKSPLGLVPGDLQVRAGVAGKVRNADAPGAVAAAPATQRVESDGAVDAARVQEIKQAIADGRFKVNPQAVADRLLATVRELLGGAGEP
jgi:negative regulator of flagellin synthesis FlgM